MANTYLTKTFASDSNRKTWTWSAWIKRSGLGGTQTLMTQVDGWNGNGNAGFYIIGDQLTSYNFTSSLNAGTDSYNRPSRYLRDVNGWYHIVVRLDTTQSTASNRCRWYVNGEQLTDFAFANYPSLNQDCNFNGGDPHGIGSHTAGANYFDGSMTHVHFTDGYSYDPSAFGETDATTGEWEAKTSPSVNYGTHGFLILKDGTTITDQSSNSNDFTLAGGTLTDLKDNPDNVFATFLPFVPRTVGSGDRNPTFSNGNTTASFNNSSSNLNAVGSIALKGKYYWETKWISANSDGSATTGIVDLSSYDNSFIGTQCVGYEDDGNKINEGTATSYGSTYASGNIIGTAFDSTTGTIWFSKDGVWQNSATISEIASGTTTNSAYTGLSTSIDWLPLASNYQSRVCNVNFGNGFFGTTAITTNSGNGYAGAEGSSKFNYTVPTGYSALNTKGLNE